MTLVRRWPLQDPVERASGIRSCYFVEVHAGRVRVETERGCGTVFIFSVVQAEALAAAGHGREEHS